jgi:hypothetical protein
VFFTSKAELTENAYTGPAGNAPNLYEYELASEPGQPGRLTDLTVDESGDGAGVLGVVQISEEGQYVYFVAKGALKGPHGEILRSGLGSEPVAGGDNLYLAHEGRTSFITTLAATDINDWEKGGLAPADEAGPEGNTAVVNPSGTRLAFISEDSLTGYDNHDAVSGKPDAEIYLYDAETSGLVCASCNPTGARPVGPSTLGTSQPIALYRARNLLEDGALFFDSSDALVPHSSDGRQNVYEYENGRTYAISNVAGGGESFFMDASASGGDVFFASADRLLPQDTSNNIAVWDARVDGGFPVTAAAPACTTAEACRVASAPAPAVFGTPPSATFSGPGNVITRSPAVVKPKPTKKTVKCKKGLVKNKKDKCVRKKSKKKAERATNDRRATR